MVCVTVLLSLVHNCTLPTSDAGFERTDQEVIAIGERYREDQAFFESTVRIRKEEDSIRNGTHILARAELAKSMRDMKFFEGIFKGFVIAGVALIVEKWANQSAR